MCWWIFRTLGLSSDDTSRPVPTWRPVRHWRAASRRPIARCRGEGVLNAAAGHSTAFATGARIFALVGQNKREFIGRMHGQLHELPNQMAVLDQMSKHVVGLRDDSAAPGEIACALAALLGGHPAPVTVECPLDMWRVEAARLATPGVKFPNVDTDAIEPRRTAWPRARTRSSASAAAPMMP